MQLIRRTFITGDEPAPSTLRDWRTATEFLGMLTVALDGRIFEANDAFVAMTGYDHADFAALTWADLTPAEFSELDRRMIAACERDGHSPPFEKDYIRKDGTRLPLLLQVVAIDEPSAGIDRRFLAYAVDLRAVLHRQSEAHDQELFSVAESIPHIVWRSDASGSNEFFNAAWREYTGLTLEESRGRGWTQAVHPDDVDRVVAALGEAARNETLFDIEIRIRSKSGRYQWFLTRASALRNPRGEITNFFGTCTNIDVQRRAAEQLAFFASFTEALTRTASVQATLERAMQLLITEDLGDWALVTRASDDGTPIVSGVHHPDPAYQAFLADAVGHTYRHLLVDEASPNVVATVSPRTIHHIQAENVEATPDLDLCGLFEAIGYESAVIVPLNVNGKRFGTLNLIRSSTSVPYTHDEISFLESIALRLGTSLAHAELLERERRIATTFQDAVLPRSLPQCVGLRFDALYEAGREEARVGGDWYDAFTLLDGRIVISVGDVSGSGLAAATLMAEARQTMRGAAAVNADPAVMLEAADRVFRTAGDDRFATAWIAVVDPMNFSLVYANAGHPAPLLKLPDGSLEALGGAGMPLGLREFDDALSSYAHVIAAGSSLVLFTDGLIEVRRDAIGGQAKLESLLSTAPSLSARAIRDAFLDGEGAHDDVAILVVDFSQCRADAAPPLVRQWSLDAREEPAVQTMRASLAAVLGGLGIDECDVRAADLMTEEIIANMLRRGRTRIRIAVDATGDDPVLHLIDQGKGSPRDCTRLVDVNSDRRHGLSNLTRSARHFSIVNTADGGSHARIVLRRERRSTR